VLSVRDVNQEDKLTSRERGGSKLLKISIICVTATGKCTPPHFPSHRAKITRVSLLNTSVEAVLLLETEGRIMAVSGADVRICESCSPIPDSIALLILNHSGPADIPDIFLARNCNLHLLYRRVKKIT
jgi:hypothetical protein